MGNFISECCRKDDTIDVIKSNVVSLNAEQSDSRESMQILVRQQTELDLTVRKQLKESEDKLKQLAKRVRSLERGDYCPVSVSYSDSDSDNSLVEYLSTGKSKGSTGTK